MKKSLKIFFWIIGIGFLLSIFSFMIGPSSLKKYSSQNIAFSYPGPWQLAEWPQYKSDLFVADNSSIVNNPGEFFTDDKNLIKFEFPAKWLIEQETFSGSEIIKHIQLISPDKKNLCLIQIWQGFKPLQQFIEDIKNAPISGAEITNFKVQKTIVKGNTGYQVFYQYNEILCKEIYFSHQNQIYRIAYLYSGTNWTKEQESNLQTILQSIEIK